MPAPALYSNIILIPGRRGDLGLRPLICCVTGSVLPGTQPGQRRHIAGERGKFLRWEGIRATLGVIQRQRTAL